MNKWLPLIFSFFLFGCVERDDVVDLCEGIVCENGGSCMDGECDCLPGFIGDNCETEQIPQGLIVVGVTIVEWPALQPDGTPWDEMDGSGPDLEIHFTSETGMPVYSSSEPFEDAEENRTYSVGEISIQLGNTPTLIDYYISLFDVDGASESTLMGQARGPLYIPGNGLPPVVTISDGDQLVFEVDLEYFF